MSNDEDRLYAFYELLILNKKLIHFNCDGGHLTPFGKY